MERECNVCEKKLTIKLNPDKTYEGGHYFTSNGEDILKGKEMWECGKCFQKAQDND